MVHRMGVDLARFERAAPHDEPVPVKLLSVGRLVEKKGFHDAITAVARNRHLPIVYQIIGSGPLEGALRTAIGRLGVGARIQLLGAASHDEVRSAMLAADVFIAPSVRSRRDGDEEGIPVAIMEAMAMRLPVLSTVHAGIPELVADGVSGYLVPERDPWRLGQRLAELVASAELRRVFGAAGRAIVERDYEMEALNDGLLARFQALLSS
jgi:colanic acid/amylovoran biosynthesis glycosyltransferase